MASNPLVFSKQDEGAMVCRQVEILVERLSYGKIFGPSKAGILPSIPYAPLHLSPFFGVCEYMDDMENCKIELEFFFFSFLEGEEFRIILLLLQKQKLDAEKEIHLSAHAKQAASLIRNNNKYF